MTRRTGFFVYKAAGILVGMPPDVPRVPCERSAPLLQFFPDADASMQRGKGLKPQFAFAGDLLATVLPAPGGSVAGRAFVPSNPSSLRPANSLASYYILWEAVWEPLAPRDPMLLRPLGANRYAVVAVWDLTDLERAVLNARVER